MNGHHLKQWKQFTYILSNNAHRTTLQQFSPISHCSNQTFHLITLLIQRTDSTTQYNNHKTQYTSHAIFIAQKKDSKNVQMFLHGCSSKVLSQLHGAFYKISKYNINSAQTLRKEFLVRVPFVFWLTHQTLLKRQTTPFLFTNSCTFDIP